MQYDTKIKDIRRVSASLVSVSLTLERVIREDMRGNVTLVKSNTDMTSLTCAGSVIVGIFNQE